MPSVAVFPLRVCEINARFCVSASIFPRRTESCKSDVSLPGPSPRRISGRFHLSHMAPWSTWLLLASPISLPLCTALSLFVHPGNGLRTCHKAKQNKQKKVSSHSIHQIQKWRTEYLDHYFKWFHLKPTITWNKDALIVWILLLKNYNFI